MKDYVCACESSMVDDSPLADISSLEESSGAPKLTLAMLPKSEKIILFEMDGRLHVDYLEKVLNMGKQGCTDIHTILQRTVQDHSIEQAATSVI